MLIIVKHLWRHNSVNIDTREMKHIPLDSSHRDESNDSKISKIESLDREIGILKSVIIFIICKFS